jgi:hypothetical protein
VRSQAPPRANLCLLWDRCLPHPRRVPVPAWFFETRSASGRCPGVPGTAEARPLFDSLLPIWKQLRLGVTVRAVSRATDASLGELALLSRPRLPFACSGSSLTSKARRNRPLHDLSLSDRISKACRTTATTGYYIGPQSAPRTDLINGVVAKGRNSCVGRQLRDGRGQDESIGSFRMCGAHSGLPRPWHVRHRGKRPNLWMAGTI